jgi:hypothetical protein
MKATVSGIQVEGTPTEMVELSAILLTGTRPKTYVCETCGRGFSTLKGRASHSRVHKRAKSK